MKPLFLVLMSGLSLASCAQQGTASLKIPAAVSAASQKGEAVATFAEGCFWHSEIVFQSLAGVRDAVSGYAGGHSKNPSYESVSTGSTGHAETVQVFYDPSVISYKTLVDAFFASQDPTQVNRQGNDRGTEYRSIAFYRNAAEKQTIEEAVTKLNTSGKYDAKIATQVMPYANFYPAEAYHQEFIAHHPTQSYVQNVSIPDFMHFKKTFKGPFKD